VLLLASRSPQRAELLREAGVPFTVIASTCDEERITAANPQVLAVERARAKAREAQRPPGACVVLGADTVVALGNETFGKPHDRADAARILGRLQGTTHTVITGHCCIAFDAAGNETASAAGIALARVTMRAMRADEIAAYIATGEADQAAGAYAIQKNGDRFVADVQGGRGTVIGLHLGTVARLFREVTDHELPGYRGDAT
jgi:septum formation protein